MLPWTSWATTEVERSAAHAPQVSEHSVDDRTITDTGSTDPSAYFNASTNHDTDLGRNRRGDGSGFPYS